MTRSAALFWLVCARCTPSGNAAPADAVFDPAWARHALWDDGLAEVSLYDAGRPQYDKIESYQALLIVVKEDFSLSEMVKADPPLQGRELLPVLKLNAVHGYWTDNYPYHLLGSVFVRRDDPTALVKVSVGSQEWCGNTFKELSTRRGRALLHWHSYFEGQAQGEIDLGTRPGDLFEDQLPLVLRGLRFRAGLRFQRRVWPSLVSNHVRQPPTPAAATFHVAGSEAVGTGAGPVDAWRVDLSLGAIQQTWWLDRAHPHALVRLKSSDGRAWLLRERVRKPYWDEPTFHPSE